MKKTTALSRFILRHQLTDDYLNHADKWFTPVMLQLIEHLKLRKSPLLLGINGCQGSGKTTLADYLGTRLNDEHALNVAVMSIDDFYYDHQQRIELADQIHPLLRTRGVPGTHDIQLALDTIDKLCNGVNDLMPTLLPRFNKCTDNPFPQNQWPVVDKNVDIIILEGWCLGAKPQATNQLIYPVNSLEASRDKQGIWRSYANQQLKQNYQKLNQRVDAWLMLKAPDFSHVHQWRLEQEEKMANLQYDLSVEDVVERVMTSTEVKNFTAYFQRITEHCLQELPENCDWVYQLDGQRHITALVQKN